MDVSVLIVGYGRAGKRHARILDGLGVLCDIVEPDDGQVGRGGWGSRWHHLQDLIGRVEYDLAVICTPPGLHLEQIRHVLDSGQAKILCEKPLCGFGQLGEARALAERGGNRVAVAHNWRWHPAFASQRVISQAGRWAVYSQQHRADLPEWGLLLDHVFHSVDTLRFLSGKEPRPANLVEDDAGLMLLGDLGDDSSFTIWERVSQDPGEQRVAYVQTPAGEIHPDLAPDVLESMFTSMWRDVLAWVRSVTVTPVSITEALRTQEALEAANLLGVGNG